MLFLKDLYKERDVNTHGTNPKTSESTMEGARLSSERRGRESDGGKLCETDRVKQKEG